MYYSQIFSYDSLKELGLLDYVLCLNNQELIEFINHKFKIKEFLKDYIPVLKYILTNSTNFSFERLKQNMGNCELVLQTDISSGGFGTTVLTETNKNEINLNKNQTYMITRYCKNNIPVNIHILISKNDIILMPPSMQNIELSQNRLIYKGSDFIKYQKVITNQIDTKLKKYATIIGELMQKKGYRGILGIDSIVYEDEVYFMEINPRFQNSSTILNKALQENHLPSLQELNYNCFYDKPILLKDFSVNYRTYINEYGIENKKFNTNPIETLDSFSEHFECETLSYLSTDIYTE